MIARYYGIGDNDLAHRHNPKVCCMEVCMLKSLSKCLFMCISIAVLISSASASGVNPALSAISEFHSDFLNHDQDQSLGQLCHPQGDDAFPLMQGGETTAGSRIWPSSQPSKEEIRMDESNPQEHIKDIDAINTKKEREIVYDGLAAPVPAKATEIKVTGNGGYIAEELDESDPAGDAIENKVDSAFAKSKMGSMGGIPVIGQASSMNNLKIDVSGVDVKAINTVPGGSAVANSNIVIKPVQVIVVPPDWKGNIEDLKTYILQRVNPF